MPNQPTVSLGMPVYNGENFLAAAAERDPNLFDDAFAQKVILTTPTTMVALAKSIAYGWRQEDSAKNSQKIAELGREMHGRMAIMVDKRAKVGDSIEKSVKSYNELVGSVESRVLPHPPEPVRVVSRDSDSSRFTSATSVSRPMKVVSWVGRLLVHTFRVLSGGKLAARSGATT